MMNGGIVTNMSLATAIKSGDTVFVGADSLMASGDTISVTKEGQGKSWKLNDSGVVFAHSGNAVNRNIIADGAFQAIKRDKRFTPQQKIVMIMSSACTKHAFVNYPIRVINTKNDDVIIIRNEEEAIKFTHNGYNTE